MNRVVIIECGAAQTRAALIVDGVVRRFWFGAARNDKNAMSAPAPGRLFAGRVQTVERRLNAAFVNIGDAQPGFLPLTKDARSLAEGALIAVLVKRAPRGGKGATLALAEAPGALTDIGRIGVMTDPAIEAAQAFGVDISTVIIDAGAAKALVKKEALSVIAVEHHRSNTGLFADYEADAALAEAFSSIIDLPGGGRLTIDETEALTAIDVDTAGMDAASPGKLKEKVNIQAARAAALQIDRRNIGGPIVIDFLKQSSSAQRAFDAELKKMFPVAQKAGWTKSGMFAFVTPRPGMSLLERFTGPAPAVPVAGRQFSLEWLAQKALQALEERLRGAPAVSFRLVAGNALAAYLKEQENWFTTLGERYGARVQLVSDPSMQERSFDISGE